MKAVIIKQHRSTISKESEYNTKGIMILGEKQKGFRDRRNMKFKHNCGYFGLWQRGKNYIAFGEIEKFAFTTKKSRIKHLRNKI